MNDVKKIILRAVAHGQRRDNMRAVATRLKDEAMKLDTMAEQESDCYVDTVAELAALWMVQHPDTYATHSFAIKEARKIVEDALASSMKERR